MGFTVSDGAGIGFAVVLLVANLFAGRLLITTPPVFSRLVLYVNLVPVN